MHVPQPLLKSASRGHYHERLHDVDIITYTVLTIASGMFLWMLRWAGKNKAQGDVEECEAPDQPTPVDHDIEILKSEIDRLTALHGAAVQENERLETHMNAMHGHLRIIPKIADRIDRIDETIGELFEECGPLGEEFLRVRAYIEECRKVAAKKDTLEAVENKIISIERRLARGGGETRLEMESTSGARMPLKAGAAPDGHAGPSHFWAHFTARHDDHAKARAEYAIAQAKRHGVLPTANFGHPLRHGKTYVIPVSFTYPQQERPDEVFKDALRRARDTFALVDASWSAAEAVERAQEAGCDWV